MAIRKEGYYYNQQLKHYILQFMAIFTGLQVKVGSSVNNQERLIEVPIHYGHKDKVVAAIFADNTQNIPIRLPTLSAHLSDIQVSERRMKGTGTERRIAYVPVGGLIPDDIQVIHQRMPVPYDITMELAIYTSNTDQFFQMLEQVLPLFNPQLNIQTSDAPFDWAKISCVKLTSIALESNHPVGTDKRIIQCSLRFELPIYIDTPADVRQDFIEQIYIRLSKIDYTTSTDMLTEFDQQGITYDIVNTDADLPFN
jgi:hypothetical protein